MKTVIFSKLARCFWTWPALHIHVHEYYAYTLHTVVNECQKCSMEEIIMTKRYLNWIILAVPSPMSAAFPNAVSLRRLRVEELLPPSHHPRAVSGRHQGHRRHRGLHRGGGRRKGKRAGGGGNAVQGGIIRYRSITLRTKWLLDFQILIIRLFQAEMVIGGTL